MGLRDWIMRQLERGEDTSDPDEVVTAATVQLFQGPVAVAMLEDNGIPAQVLENSGGVTGAPLARIMVARKHLAEAQAVVDRLR